MHSIKYNLPVFQISVSYDHSSDCTDLSAIENIFHKLIITAYQNIIEQKPLTNFSFKLL